MNCDSLPYIRSLTEHSLVFLFLKQFKKGTFQNNEKIMSFQSPVDECTNVKTIGKPVAHNSRFFTQGVWMKDPLEIMGAETIFVMEGYNTYILEEYENMNKFKAGLPRKKFKLPYTGDGTGAVVYGPHLYYNR